MQKIIETSGMKTVSEPGVYAGLDAADYHSQLTPEPSLSSSMARTLVNECPAKLWHGCYLNPDHQREEKAHFDIGQAVHLLYLETEKFAAAVDVIDADDWRKKEAQTQRDEARAAGKIPLLARTAAEIRTMRAAILAHPIAGKAFAGEGHSELSLVWRDKETGVWLKARPDWTPVSFSFIADLKTSTTANPADFSRKAYGLGYHMQAAWYLDACEAVIGTRPKHFWFVVQDKSAPFLCSVAAFDEDAIAAGRALNRQAVRQFADCVERDDWHGYRQDATPDRDTAFILTLPAWAQRDVDSTLHAAD
ncbi:MAG: PD-(D/E)XK nuclease-like domain-containing protein [Parvibaculum sp.]|uniref:PD-(D/E)XK nuclease-like domain-containing protein n=1 Tax=Parvibaculum sp. TaxID=2024848 RepID=UPI00271F8571|nr:PD-(D/E)XK nuclease-like domain-containing protein [Parvibaculum sp.]MDO8839452.1 PD-(D/E)XK nuclease-like domain-containing protein [Parvibaculum sp.]